MASTASNVAIGMEVIAAMGELPLSPFHAYEQAQTFSMIFDSILLWLFFKYLQHKC